jgi:hypothetical protein
VLLLSETSALEVTHEDDSAYLLAIGMTVMGCGDDASSTGSGGAGECPSAIPSEGDPCSVSGKCTHTGCPEGKVTGGGEDWVCTNGEFERGSVDYNLHGRLEFSVIGIRDLRKFHRDQHVDRCPCDLRAIVLSRGDKSVTSQPSIGNGTIAWPTGSRAEHALVPTPSR